MCTNIVKVDFDDYRSIKEAIKTYIRLLKADDFSYKSIEFRDKNEAVILEYILESKKLLKEANEFTNSYSSELIFVLKLIELDMEDEVTDIGWEIQKLAKRVSKARVLIVLQDVLYGTDILYVIARKWPKWSYIMGEFFQKEWKYEDGKISFDMMLDLLSKEKWNEDLIDMFTRCESQDGRRLLAKDNLKYYLSISNKYENFKKHLKSNIKEKNNPQIIEEYFKDTGYEYSVKDIQEVVNSKKQKTQKNISSRTKGYVIERNIKIEYIEIKYILSLPVTTEVMVKIDNPSGAEGSRVSKFRFQCNDGDINGVKFIPKNKGNYTLTIVVKGKPIIKEVFEVKEVLSDSTVLEENGYSTIVRYGVYGFDDKNKGSLTAQRQDRKAAIGSYFGISYRLNNEVFNDTIEVKCNVKAMDSSANIVIDESWDDIAFHDKINNFVYMIEEEKELLQGPWLFTMKHDNKMILIKEFRINI